MSTHIRRVPLYINNITFEGYIIYALYQYSGTPQRTPLKKGHLRIFATSQICSRNVILPLKMRTLYYQVHKVSTIEEFHCIQDTSPGSQGVHNRGVPLYHKSQTSPANTLLLSPPERSPLQGLLKCPTHIFSHTERKRVLYLLLHAFSQHVSYCLSRKVLQQYYTTKLGATLREQQTHPKDLIFVLVVHRTQ